MPFLVWFNVANHVMMLNYHVKKMDYVWALHLEQHHLMIFALHKNCGKKFLHIVVQLKQLQLVFSAFAAVEKCSTIVQHTIVFF